MSGQMTSQISTFIVDGRCPTKGSVRSFIHPKTGRVVSMADNRNLAQWTKDARVLARIAKVPLIYKPHGVVVDVRVEFVKPKTAKQVTPTVRPDADKLLRAILDMLTGVGYADDSQVVHATIMKAYGPSERVIVTIGRAA